jgi:hypothetical protein
MRDGQRVPWGPSILLLAIATGIDRSRRDTSSA